MPMITKIEGTENGYMLGPDASNDEWQALLGEYRAKHGKIRCVICSYETSGNFRPSLMSFGRSSLTVNNKLPGMTVYINAVR